MRHKTELCLQEAPDDTHTHNTTETVLRPKYHQAVLSNRVCEEQRAVQATAGVEATVEAQQKQNGSSQATG